MKIEVTVKDSKYKEQAAIVEKLLNQPSAMAEIERLARVALSEYLLYGTVKKKKG